MCGTMCEQGVLSTCVYVGVWSWGCTFLKKVLIPMGGQKQIRPATSLNGSLHGNQQEPVVAWLPGPIMWWYG